MSGNVRKFANGEKCNNATKRRPMQRRGELVNADNRHSITAVNVFVKLHQLRPV